MSQYTKWVACWGNATTITPSRPSRYSKDITLRYPFRCVFSGSALRFRFSNLTGTEPITLQASVAKAVSDRDIDPASAADICKNGSPFITIQPGTEVDSDAVAFDVTAGDKLAVSIYLADFTEMRAGVFIKGPLSKGFCGFGNFMTAGELPMDLTVSTNWFYFLNTVDVLTEEKNHALVCYGDSITAQSWPDYLAIRAWENGFHDVSIIRRAASGTRILRQYDCATYVSYGLKGATRFPIEINTSGVSAVLLQHGINDIIHPVGREVNYFRPMSDLPTVAELIDGMTTLYIEHARRLGLSVWAGTLVPIYGWRTYAQFREDMRLEFNQWILSTDLVDGAVDFSAAICDPKHPERFDEGCDSGDHLHPSELAYSRMADAVPEELLR